MSDTFYPPAPGATPVRTPTYLAMHAHYHAIRVTEKWAQLVQGMQADAINSAPHRAARDRERLHETTYYRHTTGGS